MERTLYSEVMMMIKPGFVSNVYRTGMVRTPGGYKSTKIMVQNMYSMVSLITMIAPSPDWFVGVDSYDLCGMNGWKEKVTMDLLPWDAGTENGQTYSSDNMATTPVDVIMRITSNSNSDIGKHANITFATVTFTREEMITTTTTVRTTATERTTTDSSAPGLSAGLFVFLSISLLAIVGVLCSTFAIFAHFSLTHGRCHFKDAVFSSQRNIFFNHSPSYKKSTPHNFIPIESLNLHVHKACWFDNSYRCHKWHRPHKNGSSRQTRINIL